MLPLLRRAAPSRIVNVGSVFGDIGYPLFAAYSSSKFALRGLSIALRREFKPFGIGVTYAAPRATKTGAAEAYGALFEPLQMRMDEPAVVADRIWRAVAKDADNVYAKGPERLFVLAQRLFPTLVDRAIAAQLADPRVVDYLNKRQEAVAAAANAVRGTRASSRRDAKLSRSSTKIGARYVAA